VQPVVLFSQLGHLRIARDGYRDDIANYPLQLTRVFWQCGQIDLHGGMMNNAAASLKAVF
jgi:hypothetical protein